MMSSLEIWDMTAGMARVVLQTDRHIEAPNWSPDSSYLLVNGEGRLFRVALDAPALHPVPMQMPADAARGCNNDHGISPDGKTYIVSSHHQGNGSQIYTMPAAGGDLQEITPDAPSWWHGISPDGQTLAYVAARGSSRVIDVYTKAWGQPERRLTFGEGHCDGPDYAPDGARIYYNCDRSGHAQIWVMNADGSDQRQLFADEYVNWFPHPSPDGQNLLYLAYPTGTLGHPANLPVALCLCNPDGTNRRRIIEFTGGQGSINVPCWALDSSAFAFVRYHGLP
jgi:Tol biopolymer transport system component